MIEVYELAKCYGSAVAVDGLTFEVHPGRVTGFLGPNGSGKSTTMRVILGLDAPDAGEALVCDQHYRRLVRPLGVVGALLDAEAVHGGRTAFRHVEAINPPVLMFDEPVNGLDPEGIRWIRQLMKSLAAEGRTVFVSSHLMSEMALTADHVIVIGRGQLITDGPVSDLTRSGSGGDVLVRSPRRAELAALLQREGAAVEPEPGGGLAITGLEAAAIASIAASAGIAIHELTPRHASLEEAYLELSSDSAEYRAAPPVRPGHLAARTGKDS